MQILKCPQSNYKLWDVCTSQKKLLLSCLWHCSWAPGPWHGALLISYIKSLCPMHCRSTAVHLSQLWVHWKAQKSPGKWDRIFKCCWAWACSVGWSLLLFELHLELCLRGFISKDTQGWAPHPWNSWISPINHLWKSDLCKWVRKGSLECWLLGPFCLIQQHLVPVFDIPFVILNVPAFLRLLLTSSSQHVIQQQVLPKNSEICILWAVPNNSIYDSNSLCCLHVVRLFLQHKKSWGELELLPVHPGYVLRFYFPRIIMLLFLKKRAWDLPDSLRKLLKNSSFMCATTRFPFNNQFLNGFLKYFIHTFLKILHSL